jgi:hypothetical protein
MINVVKQMWSWELNGYIDYLINVSSCGIFFANLRGQKINKGLSFEKIKFHQI